MKKLFGMNHFVFIVYSLDVARSGPSNIYIRIGSNPYEEK